MAESYFVYVLALPEVPLSHIHSSPDIKKCFTFESSSRCCKLAPVTLQHPLPSVVPMGLLAVNNQRVDIPVGCMTLNPTWTWVLF